jgi:hypothetical protein
MTKPLPKQAMKIVQITKARRPSYLGDTWAALACGASLEQDEDALKSERLYVLTTSPLDGFARDDGSFKRWRQVALMRQ